MTIKLPFFVNPLSTELQVRTLTAQVARGFCWHITSPPGGAVRSSLGLRFLLNLQNRLPTYKLASQLTPLPTHFGNQLLQLAAAHWRRDLADFNTHWIALEFQQLMSIEQLHAIRLATSFLNHAQFFPLIERLSIMQLSDRIPQDVLHRLESSLASLEAALLSKDPLMPQHLRNTHSLLISYPETVHLLDDNEIARIIDAAEVHTKTEIVKAAASGRSTGGTRTKVSASDL
jgi:hypothetical protein